MRTIPTICAFLFSFTILSQSVGLVLSGGGAAGMAHIGVLKALEEKNIKIDYITGTSAGALIGGLYASGYTPAQIEAFAMSEEFQRISKGDISSEYQYFYYEEDVNANWLHFRFSKDSILSTSLPTNFVDPSGIDFTTMMLFAQAGAACKNNFDSLMIPYRCLSSDIERKASVILSRGRLSNSVRASMSYPFFLKPITIDGVLYFDGGLYNNFPADVMDSTFRPDFIIGSNVSGNLRPPSQNSVLSHIMNMIVSKSNFNVPEDRGILIEPNLDEVGTFDFDEIHTAINQGYTATINKIDSIRSLGIPEMSREDIDNRRAKFNAKKPDLSFRNFRVTGCNDKQSKYSHHVLKNKQISIDSLELKKRYFKLVKDDKVNFLYPSTDYNYEDSAFDVSVHLVKENEFMFELGGNFSSRSINTGYLGLEYNHFGSIGIKLKGNSYFGKYYGAAYGSAKFNFATMGSFYFEPFYSLNRWDFFRSFATFFDESQPSFIIHQEQFGGLKMGIPVGNRAMLSLTGLYADFSFRYYQTDQFSASDTADVTRFYPIVAKLDFTHSTLNRKQYANQGTYINFRANALRGNEVSVHGSTQVNKDTSFKAHEWGTLRLQFSHFMKPVKFWTLGVHFDGVYSSQKFFNNYTASVINAPAFEPVPEMKTFYLPQFRAYQFIAGGANMVFNFTKNIEFRMGAYAFQPIWQIARDEDDGAYVGESFKGLSWINSGAIVYHSPLGPISANINFYDRKEDPWSISLNFGYILNNEKAIQ